MIKILTDAIPLNQNRYKDAQPKPTHFLACLIWSGAELEWTRKQ